MEQTKQWREVWRIGNPVSIGRYIVQLENNVICVGRWSGVKWYDARDNDFRCEVKRWVPQPVANPDEISTNPDVPLEVVYVSLMKDYKRLKESKKVDPDKYNAIVEENKTIKVMLAEKDEELDKIKKEFEDFKAASKCEDVDKLQKERNTYYNMFNIVTKENEELKEKLKSINNDFGGDVVKANDEYKQRLEKIKNITINFLNGMTKQLSDIEATAGVCKDSVVDVPAAKKPTNRTLGELRACNELNIATYKSLASGGFVTLEDVSKVSKKDLYKLQGFGDGTYRDISFVLIDNGYNKPM